MYQMQTRTKVSAEQMLEAGFEQIQGYRVLDWSKSQIAWDFQVKSDSFFIDSEGKSPGVMYQLAENVDEVTFDNIEKLIFSDSMTAKLAVEKVAADNEVAVSIHGDLYT